MQTLNKNFNYKTSKNFFPATYDHRVWNTGLPVRSAVLKPHAGRLVVGWVTTSESRLSHVFCSPIFGGLYCRNLLQCDLLDIHRFWKWVKSSWLIACSKRLFATDTTIPPRLRKFLGHDCHLLVS